MGKQDRDRSVGKGQSGPGRQRDNKRKMSPKPESGSKKRRSETQPGPSDDNNSQNVKRQKARKDALNNHGKVMYGAGETGTLRRIGQKNTGTPKPVARPTIPRSGAKPVPADDVPDVDQPLTNLPDASLRKLKR